MRSSFFVAFALASMLVACVPAPESIARARAVSDLSCPYESLETVEFAPATVDVRGCGKRTVYTCPRSGPYGRVCIREADQGATPR